MFVSLSKVDKQAVVSFTKVLAVMAYAHDSEFELPSNIRRQLSSWVTQSEPFLTAFQIRKPLFARMVEGLVSGGRPSDGDTPTSNDTEELAKILRKKLVNVDKDTNVDTQLVKIMKDFNSVALRQTQSALDRIIVAVSHLGDPVLSSMFKFEVEDQSDIVKQLDSLVTKMKGKDLLVDADRKKELQKTAKGKDLVKNYNRLRRELNAVPKQFIMTHIRNHKMDIIPAREVRNALKKAGITHHSVPEGFVGGIDDQLRYYTSKGKLLNGVPSGEVKMNPNYDSKTDTGAYLKYQMPTAKAPSPLYTVEHKQAGTAKKFNAVSKLANNVSKIRRKWLADLRKGINTKDGVKALLCELVYETSGRIGSKAGKTDGKTTFGLTTVNVGHYKKKEQSRLLEYPGKKAQIQKHLIKPTSLINKLMISYLDELAKGKTRKDYLITFKGNIIRGTSLNNYLRTLGMPQGVTIHKFRTLRGTALAKRLLKAHPFKGKSPTSKVVNAWLTKALMQVAKELGHFTNGKLTVSTAIQNYIDPTLLDNFFSEVGVRPSAIIEKAIAATKKNKD